MQGIGTGQLALVTGGKEIYMARVIAGAQKQAAVYGGKTVCGCGTKLSRYNPVVECGACTVKRRGMPSDTLIKRVQDRERVVV